MNIAQIKDEIRKLNQIDKVEIFRWIDREAVSSDLFRIGAYRSIQIRQDVEERLKAIIPIPKRRARNDEEQSPSPVNWSRLDG